MSLPPLQMLVSALFVYSWRASVSSETSVICRCSAFCNAVSAGRTIGFVWPGKVTFDWWHVRPESPTSAASGTKSNHPFSCGLGPLCGVHWATLGWNQHCVVERWYICHGGCSSLRPPLPRGQSPFWVRDSAVRRTVTLAQAGIQNITVQGCS